MSHPEVLPRDEHNAELVAQTHPQDWQNPAPAMRYDLVVIGGGTAGLVSAAGTARLGGKVALIERHLLGGDCLNYGCVPSKSLIRAARAAYEVRQAGELGVKDDKSSRNGGGQGVDFAAVMARMRRIRAAISHHDSAERFTGLGVDVFLGDARFIGQQSVEVKGAKLLFKRAIIATGARAAVPEVPGLKEAGYWTNESVFSITELPQRLVVIGGGPLGCELAQAFCRFGSRVTIIQRSARLVDREEPPASELIAEQFKKEGIEVHLSARLLDVELLGTLKRLRVEVEGQTVMVDADAILVAAGRKPNLDGLNLDAAGVAAGERGVQVNDYLQTTHRRIYAAGDVVGSYQFTHAADAMARICVQNAFFSLGFLGRRRLSRLIVPRATYTDPEIASVGLTESAARTGGIQVDSYREELRHVDRAIIDGQESGFAIIHTRQGTGSVVGCTIVGSHAGEMIGEAALLMTAGLDVKTLASTIHCYPTQVEVLKRLGDQYNSKRLTPAIARLLRTIIAWRL